ELHRGSANRRPPALTPARTAPDGAADDLGRSRELPRTEARTAWDAAANCLGRGRELPGTRPRTAWDAAANCLGRGRERPPGCGCGDPERRLRPLTVGTLLDARGREQTVEPGDHLMPGQAQPAADLRPRVVRVEDHLGADLLQLRGAVTAQPHQRGRRKLPVPASSLERATLVGGFQRRHGTPGRLLARLAHGRP